MSDEEFNQVMNQIRTNVESFISSGDEASLASNEELWSRLIQADRAGQATVIFNDEALAELAQCNRP